MDAMDKFKKVMITIQEEGHQKLKAMSEAAGMTMGELIHHAIFGLDARVELLRLQGKLPGQIHRAHIRELIVSGDARITREYADIIKSWNNDNEQAVSLSAGRQASLLYAEDLFAIWKLTEDKNE